MEGKQFVKWFAVKQRIHETALTLYCQDRDIWVCSIGENVGREQNGKREMFQRPVLVLKRFGNGTFLGIPMTSKFSLHRTVLQISGGSFLLLSQMRLWDGRRLIRKVRRMAQREFEYIKSEVIALIKK
ncbi:MAG: hypothetical protein A3C15_01760 [Candidatus Magasanikbacteria bacterium RIFCSPHIGHO2_02_FULL_50_9b]|uniref:Uncharacterized protein n=1 Tax=Candidatus Magasanikbacteria bacterium RIFCSPHIGHO2_02_FULL_50_9b TaxID=1798682 RepID=A0A1F6M8K8_9BACT|nr:MAG: hypothetical protein A3C15_01760 [Candidatus Magasanikbacteria bacterium RIFCSPHIGHO2_02_FULL_50_9b]